jgi:hypothetical protein
LGSSSVSINICASIFFLILAASFKKSSSDSDFFLLLDFSLVLLDFGVSLSFSFSLSSKILGILEDYFG